MSESGYPTPTRDQQYNIEDFRISCDDNITLVAGIFMVLFVLALISRLQGRELGIDEYRPSLQLRMCEQMTAILDEDEYNKINRFSGSVDLIFCCTIRYCFCAENNLVSLKLSINAFLSFYGHQNIYNF